MKTLGTEYHSCVNDLISSLDKLKQHGTEEAVHQFRVSVKRIQAIVKLLEHLAPDKFSFPRKDRMHKLFNSAGRFREIQLHEDFMRSHPLSESAGRSFQAYLKRKKNSYKIAFITQQKAFKPTSLIKACLNSEKVCQSLSHRKTTSKIKRFILHEQNKVKLLSEKKWKTLRTHQIRRRLKALELVLILYDQIKSNAKLRAAIVRVKRINSLLGKWHDKIEIIKRLKLFGKGNSLYYNELRQLILRLEKENNIIILLSKTKMPLALNLQL
jgi:CHAD domain-containing protein